MCKFSKYFIFLAVFAGAGCASGPQADESDSIAAVSSESAPSNQVASAQETGSDEEELVCRREIVTGSNFRRRVCRTRAEMREAGEQSQEFLENQRTRTTDR